MAPASNFPQLPELTEAETDVPRAYHGTNLEDAQSILVNGFRWSRGPKHFLGDGVYFFEDQYEEALAWANDPQCTKPPAAVLKCSVRLKRCLNFYQQVHMEAYGKLEVFFRAQKRQVTPAAIINALAAHLDADSVRGPFRGRKARPTRKASYPFETEIRMILCVRNVSNILTPEIVYPTAV